MNTATPLGARGRSVIGGERHVQITHRSAGAEASSRGGLAKQGGVMAGDTGGDDIQESIVEHFPMPPVASGGDRDEVVDELEYDSDIQDDIPEEFPEDL